MTNIRPLPDALQKIAIEELNEVPERIASDVQALKTWISQQNYLRARTDEQFLISFLRGSKYSLERAKSKLDRFYTLRSQFPGLFNVTDVDDTKFREVLNLGVLLSLPTPLNNNGPRILLLRNGAYPAEKYDFADVFRVGQAIQEVLMMEDDYCNVYGVTTILDLADVTIGHFFQMTPPIMKKLAVYSEEAMAQREKGSHFIYTPAGFYQVYNIFKPMLSPKQQNRLFVHGDKLEQLYEHIPQKYLPKEYGGENSSIPEIISYWNAKFDEYRDFFKENSNFGTNEKLRPGKPIDFDSLFGIDGSFRKLEVD